jgi:hydroxymethylpyrimidine/phosphomethylpyrimidine kinase
MLHSCAVIKCVQRKLEEYNVKNSIIDPVMVATSGDTLLDKDAISCLKLFLTKAVLVTPNIPEAELLIGHKINRDTIESAAKEIGERFKTSILLKGGHLKHTSNTITDVLYLKKTEELIGINNQKIRTIHTHGTGCSLSSSIAAFLSLGYSMSEAVYKGCA